MNDTGQKVFLWYRIYCAAMALLYVAVMSFGIFMLVAPFETSPDEALQVLIIGTLNSIVGATFFIAFIAALFLPPKSFNWIVGIVMMAIGMTSCCTWPAVIPLFIYWLKPETREFFERN